MTAKVFQEMADKENTALSIIRRRRIAHHKALAKLAGGKVDGLKLWRKLRAIERSLYAQCEHYTNGTGGVDLKQWEREKEAAREALRVAFGGKIPTGVYINGDPRGHMLKLDCGSAGEPGVPIPEGMEKDWGGNGILAAEINED